MYKIGLIVLSFGVLYIIYNNLKEKQPVLTVQEETDIKFAKKYGLGVDPIEPMYVSPYTQGMTASSMNLCYRSGLGGVACSNDPRYIAVQGKSK